MPRKAKQVALPVQHISQSDDVKRYNIAFHQGNESTKIRKVLIDVLQQRDAPKARRFLRRVMDGRAWSEPDRRTTDSALKLRADAAKVLLALAGYVAPKASDAAAPGAKDPSEMTSDDLRQFIARAEGELAARATPIEVSAPIEAGLPDQLAAMIE